MLKPLVKKEFNKSNLNKNKNGKPPLYNNNPSKLIQNHTAQDNRQNISILSPEKSGSAGAGGSTQTIYEFLNDAIHEYFLKRNYHNTLECFKDEISILPNIPKRGSYENNINLEQQIMEVMSILVYYIRISIGI